MFTSGIPYLLGVGVGALAGFFVGVGLCGDLTASTLVWMAAGTLAGGLVPTLWTKSMLILRFAFVSLIGSVLLGTLIGVVVAGRSGFSCGCAVLGCVVGCCLFCPMVVHSLLGWLARRFLQRCGRTLTTGDRGSTLG